MYKLIPFLLCFFGLGVSNCLYSQGCCSVSIPTLGSTECPSTDFGSLRIGFNYLYTNTSTTYQYDTKIQDPLNRKAFGHNVAFDFELGIWDNLSVFILFPYNFYYRSTIVIPSQEKIYKNSGVGDITLLLKYNFLASTFAIQTRLSLGGGLKLPTGEFQTESQGVQLPLDIQSGTGTIDFFLWGLFTTNLIPNLTITQSALFKFAGKNSEGYDIGNEFLTVTGLNYNFIYFLQGNLLIRIQNRWQDRLNVDNLNQLIPNSGRVLIEAIPGLVLNYLNVLTTRIFFVYPIYTKVNGTQLAPSWRFGTEFHYIFNLF